MTGAQAAQRILNSAGIYDVTIQHVSGNLTDHYNPSAKTLNLSDSVYNSTSVAAVGVAAHECGHAIQHQNIYFPLTLRTAIVPVANLGSTLAWPLILIGLFFTRNTGAVLINLGIICFSFAVIFKLVTLPVEFNESARALRILGEQGILSDSELPYTKKVLKAAALTYVASAAAAILQLLRLILIEHGTDHKMAVAALFCHFHQDPEDQFSRIDRISHGLFLQSESKQNETGHLQYSADECVSVEIYGFRAGLRSVQ